MGEFLRLSPGFAKREVAICLYGEGDEQCGDLLGMGDEVQLMIKVAEISALDAATLSELIRAL